MRYSGYGQRDSRHADDGDMSFIRMVTRLNPEQLQPGEVAYSQNGRMDNNRRWEVRDGSWKVLEKASEWAGATNTGTVGLSYYVDPTTSKTWLFTKGPGKTIIATRPDPSPTTVERVLMYVPYTLELTRGSMLSAKDGIYLFNADESRPLKFSGAINPHIISSAVRASNVVTVTTTTDHLFTTGDVVSVFLTADFSTTINGVHTVTGAPSSTTFTFAQTAANEGPRAQATTAGTCYTFEELSGTATTATSDDNVGMSVSSGVCTVTKTSHTRPSNDVLTVYDGGGSGLIEGDKFAVTYVDANSYKFYAEIPDGSYTVSLGGKQPLSGGYITISKCRWGVMHESRLVLPYDSSGNAGDTDEIIYSDIFDYETFDPIVNQLRFGISSDDFVQNYIPITADRAVVLCKHSVHLVVGVAGSLADLQRYEITREVGCIARASAVFANGRIIFMSSRGLSSIVIGDGYDLFMEPVPLTEPIDNIIKPWKNIDESFAIYAKNRYYLFLPNLGSPTGIIAVYNFLNQGWESFDEYKLGATPTLWNDAIFISSMDDAAAADFPLATDGYIFAKESSGGIFLLEYVPLGYDQDYSGNNTIDGYVKTRAYQFGDLNHKRFTRASVLALDSEGTTVNIKSVTQDPEETLTIYMTADMTDDANVKARISRRGRSVQVQYEAAIGGIKGCSVDAILSSFSDVTRL